MVESDDQMKPIGGYFELADKDLEDGRMPIDGIALNTCRNALEYVILHISDIRRVFVPYYTCEAVVEPLKKFPIEYVFYHINEHLEIADEPDLLEGDYLIANNYFGIKDAYIALLAEKYGERLIVDNAQALFAPVLSGIKAVYSARKFVGVADGGFAVGVSADSVSDYEVDNSSGRDTHLYIRRQKGAEAGFRDYQDNECRLDNQPIRRMSPQTQIILSHIDYSSVIEKRRKMYQFISIALKDCNQIYLPSMDSFACPMVYPFLTTDDSLRERLIKNKVFVARYWPNVLNWVTSQSVEYRFVNHIIPIPIDQRYNIEDMQRIINIIKK